ncbi:unnamed protein product [Prunus armeniaca]
MHLNAALMRNWGYFTCSESLFPPPAGTDPRCGLSGLQPIRIFFCICNTSILKIYKKKLNRDSPSQSCKKKEQRDGADGERRKKNKERGRGRERERERKKE